MVVKKGSPRFLAHQTKVRRLCIFSFLFMLICCSAGVEPGLGASYYVKNGGNDALDGLSDATAWASVAKVQATAKSGDVVFFRSQDTWSAVAPPVLTANAGVTYDGSSYGSGTKATLQAAGDAVNWPNYSVVKIEVSNVTFKGFNVDANHFRCGGIYLGYLSSTDVANTVIDNCIIHGIGGISGDWIYGIEVGNKNGRIISNTTITNTTVHDTFHEGISIYAGWSNANNRNDGVLVRGCTVYDTGVGSPSSMGISALLVCNDSRNVTVEYNNFYNSNLGVWVRVSPTYEGTVTYAPQNLTVRYNLIHDNERYGIYVVNWRKLKETASFYGNILYQNGQSGFGDTGDIRFEDSSSSSDYTADTVFNIYNNTLYPTSTPGSNSAAAVGFGYFGSITAGTFNLKNNIIYSGGYRAIMNRFGTLVNHSNNQIYRSSAATDIHVTSAGTNYNRTAVTTWEPTAKNTAPAFAGGALPTSFAGSYGRGITPDTSFFSVSAGDAIDSGTPLGPPFDGCINGAGLATVITRPQGAGYDLGAYEYVTKLPLPAPTGLQITE